MSSRNNTTNTNNDFAYNRAQYDQRPPFRCYNCGEEGHSARVYTKPRQSQQRFSDHSRYPSNNRGQSQPPYNREQGRTLFPDRYPDRDDFCRYHRKFGDHAYSCYAPCNYWKAFPGTNLDNRDYRNRPSSTKDVSRSCTSSDQGND